MFRRFSTSASSGLSVFREGTSVRVLLDRPKALNALNLPMIRDLAPIVPTWTLDPSVHCVVLEGNGDTAFCAGGDIKLLHSGTREEQEAFFREEYALDFELASSATRVPHVALYDGVTMGGGVGISINAPFRIATERAIFAMPETGIGFFPDVGGSYFLPRLPGHTGTFLALTGARLRGEECVAAGVATHFVPSNQLAALKTALGEVTSRDVEEVGAVVGQFCQAKVECGSGLDAEGLEDIFSGDTVEEILSRITEVTRSKDAKKWVVKAKEALVSASPTSLKVTLEQIKRGADLSLPECYQMELHMAMRFMNKGSDFYEGVRALLVDKDNNPEWNPPSITKVPDELVQEFFQKQPDIKDLALPLENALL